MNLSRAVAWSAPILLSLTVLATPAAAQGRSSLDAALLAQLDGPTRAEVERRAVAGNTVSNVVGTILLNNYYKTGARHPGRALTVVAVDFPRGTVVLRRAANVFEVVRFDPRTLRILR